ncbi:hypothetical protein [Ohessyouella blattaphilus]|uniref:Conjugal transfer protein n=1 Tax=Ohessyouella blattaphilus TaxID=2949333 RepID=A0ABT1EHT1_9FIRM|nr:hypothetical protein [Ohessyouella blattaphilus]MCP1110264.1 hypothetical protein [Ohessyouella blattaphilus]MCR8563658.1 hypothetical protein [Ohessyouella blattaphilus]
MKKNKVRRKEEISMKVLATLGTVKLGVLTYAPYANATGAGAGIVSSGFNNLIDVVKAIVTSIGILLTLWGIGEFGISMSSQDGASQAHAMKRIGGGILAALAPQILLTLVQ